MNEEVTVVLKLHRKYVGNGVTIGYLSVGDCYLCETLERTPLTLPSGMYNLEPGRGTYYSMQWDITEGVPDWYKKSCNDKPKIRTRPNDYITYTVEQAKPETEGIIDLGYLYGVLSGGKWWRKGFDDIMRSFVRLTPKGVSKGAFKYQLQIL